MAYYTRALFYYQNKIMSCTYCKTWIDRDIGLLIRLQSSGLLINKFCHISAAFKDPLKTLLFVECIVKSFVNPVDFANACRLTSKNHVLFGYSTTSSQEMQSAIVLRRWHIRDRFWKVYKSESGSSSFLSFRSGSLKSLPVVKLK